MCDHGWYEEQTRARKEERERRIREKRAQQALAEQMSRKVHAPGASSVSDGHQVAKQVA